MSSFLIPTSNEELFLKKIARFVKKANGGIKVVPTDNYEYVDYTTNDNKKIQIQCRWYEVEGTYKLNGWTLVGEIEHKENGNVLRIIEQDYSEEATSLYKDAQPRCDHCGTNRIRNNTFIVYNEEKKEYKQVGKNCLMDYTGFDSERCAAIASIIKVAEDMETPDEERVSHGSKYINNETYRKVCYAYVENNGYSKEIAKNESLDWYFDSFKNTDFNEYLTVMELNGVNDTHIEQVSEWIEKTSKQYPNNAYYQSCKVIWGSDYIEYRDINYQLSMLSNYFREVQNSLKTTSEYVGQIGDRIIVDVKKTRVLYEKGKYAYNGPYVCMLEIVDKEGHTYLWSTSNYELEYGTKIKATVKGYKEYKGVKQTVITRGTIIEKPVEEGSENTKKFVNCVDSLFKEWHEEAM